MPEPRFPREEVSKKTLTYITAALGLVAGLAWNEAITSLITALFPATTETLLAKFIYAIVITLLIVVASAYLVRILKREQREKEP